MWKYTEILTYKYNSLDRAALNEVIQSIIHNPQFPKPLFIEFHIHMVYWHSNSRVLISTAPPPPPPLSAHIVCIVNKYVPSPLWIGFDISSGGFLIQFVSFRFDCDFKWRSANWLWFAVFICDFPRFSHSIFISILVFPDNQFVQGMFE